MDFFFLLQLGGVLQKTCDWDRAFRRLGGVGGLGGQCGVGECEETAMSEVAVLVVERPPGDAVLTIEKDVASTFSQRLSLVGELVQTYETTYNKIMFDASSFC